MGCFPSCFSICNLLKQRRVATVTPSNGSDTTDKPGVRYLREEEKANIARRLVADSHSSTSCTSLNTGFSELDDKSLCRIIVRLMTLAGESRVGLTADDAPAMTNEDIPETDLEQSSIDPLSITLDARQYDLLSRKLYILAMSNPYLLAAITELRALAWTRLATFLYHHDELHFLFMAQVAIKIREYLFDVINMLWIKQVFSRWLNLLPRIRDELKAAAHSTDKI